MSVPDYAHFINHVTDNKCLISMTWDDAPHLSEEDKEKYWEGVPVHERKARAKGIPSLGAGAIWPIDEERIKCESIPIPEYWPCAYAIDPGWNNTACLWGAWDRDSDIVYIWSDYKQGEEKPAVHVEAVNSRGKWIPGVMDPASRGRSQDDGKKLLDEYLKYDLDLDLADNAVESGIFAVYRRMVTGRLKIFDTCVAFWSEFRLYQRDKNGKVIKDKDHLMDCLRYLIMSGMDRAVNKLEAFDMEEQLSRANKGNATTGY